MQERSVIAREAAAGLRRFADQRSKFPVLIGFDGFVDSIIAVVDKRHDVEHYEPMETIDQLGRRILAAAGQSANFELVVKLEKLGGNGPIYANAMMALGFPVTYIGALGWPEPHPVFADLNKRARCYSLGPPGMTDAFEFRDGKLMFGKHDALKAVNWKAIEDVIGVDKFAQIIAESRLIGTVNWTMLTRLNEIWRKLIDELLPACKGPRKLIFVDLADPEKRLREDLREALSLCTDFQQHADVVLGLNLKEAVQVSEVLGIDPSTNPEAAIESLARSIREKLNLHGVVIHPRSCAAAAIADGSTVSSAKFAGPFVAEPKLSTGAGDEFNAGFSLARLAGLSVEQALACGTGASGYYVRNAGSPTLEQLADFLDALPPPQAS